jgi:hypothetical protein
MLVLTDTIALVEFFRRAPLDMAFIGLGGARFEHSARLSGVALEGMNALAERVLALLTCLGVMWRLRNTPTFSPPRWQQRCSGIDGDEDVQG